MNLQTSIFFKETLPLNHQAKTSFSKNSDLSLPTRETGASVSGIPKFWSEFRYHLLHWQNSDRKSRKITKIRCSKTIRMVLFFNFSGIKVNSVQEACTKCFTVHIWKFEILQNTWKKWNKGHQTLTFQFFTNRFSIIVVFVNVYHVGRIDTT